MPFPRLLLLLRTIIWFPWYSKGCNTKFCASIFFKIFNFLERPFEVVWLEIGKPFIRDHIMTLITEKSRSQKNSKFYQKKMCFFVKILRFNLRVLNQDNQISVVWIINSYTSYFIFTNWEVWTNKLNYIIKMVMQILC